MLLLRKNLIYKVKHISCGPHIQKQLLLRGLFAFCTSRGSVGASSHLLSGPAGRTSALEVDQVTCMIILAQGEIINVKRPGMSMAISIGQEFCRACLGLMS